MTQHPLADALLVLTEAEAAYRKAHDLHGDGSREAGRAWDVMRRAGDNARKALSQYEKSDTDRDQLREICAKALGVLDRYAFDTFDWEADQGRLARGLLSELESVVPANLDPRLAALASKTAIDPATVGTSNCDGLEDHFPTGLRSKLGVTKDTLRWYSDGVIQCECECGASFTGTDEQEVRQLWAEHALAAIRALGKDQ